MVIIRINAQLPPVQAQIVVEGIHTQAHTGVIVLPNFCELLNEVPADETIKVVQHAGDCETCRERPGCQYNHGRRGIVRINCPLWRAKV